MAVGNIIDLYTLVEIFIGITIIAAGWLYILSWFYEARRMMKWRTYAFAITIGFTLSMFFNAIGMITVVNELQSWTNILFYLTIGALLLTFFGVGMIAKDIANLERLGVGLKRMEKVKFSMDSMPEKTEETGVDCIDDLMTSKPSRAPLMLYGQDGTHPWRLAQEFTISGLVKGEPSIYFAISRPPELVIDQMNKRLAKRGKKLEDYKDNFVIVDCFTPFAGLSERETFLLDDDYKKNWKYVDADPRDLNDVHRAYRHARKLIGDRTNYRVVFDSFSGIVELADEQLLYQYLLHTLTSEEKFRVMSMYIMREQDHVDQMGHLMSGVINLTSDKGERFIEIKKISGKFRAGKHKISDTDRVVSKTLKRIEQKPPEPKK